MRKIAIIGFIGLLIAACGQGNSKSTSAPVPTAQPPVSTAPIASPVEASTPAEELPSFEGLPEPYQSADYNVGRRTFRLCASCHFLKSEMGNSVGPNLAGIFGRHAGALEGFSYSKAYQEADFVWTPEQMDKMLDDPRNFLPGNRMIFQGVRKQGDREAVIAYMMKETGYSKEE